MTNRREAIIGLAAGAAAGVTASAIASEREAAALRPGEQLPSAEPTREEPCACCGSDQPRPVSGKLFPSVPVIAHTGRRAIFYEDLIRDKTVLVNFMSIASDRDYPVTANLVRVQRLLGEQLGRDVFMYSISLDPTEDTPAALAEFAREQRVGPGWLFLTGDSGSLAQVHGSFFIGHAGHHQQASGPDCSLGLARYGNDAVGTWGSVATRTSPAWIAARLAWVQPRPTPGGRPRRKGPPPLSHVPGVPSLNEEAARSNVRR